MKSAKALPRYGSGHKSAGRTDGKTDNAKLISLRYKPTNQQTGQKQYVPHYYIHIRKNAPPTGGHVFLSNWNQFQTCPNIIGTNLLTKCHDDRTINMASRVLTGGHVFPPTRTIFELIQDIIRTNHLTKFHNNRKINVAYRVFTMKNAPPPDIIRTNLLTKFHEDKKINVAYRVLTKFYYSHIR
ncbi:hypothetical protein DPMN_147503 [Dreissena polymorpha]|uniref:Uncharacterized protein n=1 Tax=Dreissena polymorpha TaxID=45954 RepID=A0A9D4F7Z8_DREPO|nr:hypothetical protein DPMN_147503 [Dreissena polymorpha]